MTKSRSARPANKDNFLGPVRATRAFMSRLAEISRWRLRLSMIPGGEASGKADEPGLPALIYFALVVLAWAAFEEACALAA